MQMTMLVSTLRTLGLSSVTKAEFRVRVEAAFQGHENRRLAGVLVAFTLLLVACRAEVSDSSDLGPLDSSTSSSTFMAPSTSTDVTTSTTELAGPLLEEVDDLPRLPKECGYGEAILYEADALDPAVPSLPHDSVLDLVENGQGLIRSISRNDPVRWLSGTGRFGGPALVGLNGDGEPIVHVDLIEANGRWGADTVYTCF